MLCGSRSDKYSASCRTPSTLRPVAKTVPVPRKRVSISRSRANESDRDRLPVRSGSSSCLSGGVGACAKLAAEQHNVSINTPRATIGRARLLPNRRRESVLGFL